MGFMARSVLMLLWKMIGKADEKRKATQSPTPGVAGDRDLEYVPGGCDLQRLDVYYPEGTEGLLPVIIDVHGGGWVYGNKELNEYFCLSLASRGFAVVNISYRLLPDTDLRGQVEDVLHSLHWLGQHGPEHHCDLNRVFITGDSAGGHLSSLVTAIVADPKLRVLYGIEPLPYAIKGVAVNHIAPHILDKMMGVKSVDMELVRMFFGAEPQTNPIYGRSTIYETANPDIYPPILVVTSRGDPFHTHSMKLYDHLKEQGFRCELAIPEQSEAIDKISHVFNITDPYCDEGYKMNDRITTFFINL